MKNSRTVRLAVPAATFALVAGIAAPARAAADPERLLKVATDDASLIAQNYVPDPGSTARQNPDLNAAFQAIVGKGAVGVIGRSENGWKTKTAAVGRRALDSNEAARKNDRFRVASNSKMMVATLVMQQVQTGRWTLDTTVESVLPGLLPGHGDVTLEQLLSHTSGMPDGVGVAIAKRMANPLDYREFVRALGYHYDNRELVAGAMASKWLPAGKYSYSNAGYVVLGMMLEEATGQDLGRLLDRRIFKRIGMYNTTYPTAPGLPGASLVGGAFAQGAAYSLKGFNPSIFGPAGAVVSTTTDLNTFTEALMTGRLLSPRWVEEMKKPRSERYGLGIYRVPDPCHAGSFLYGHSGATFGTFSYAMSSPDGRRQIATGTTGRYLESLEQPYPTAGAFVAAAKANC